MLRWAGPRAMDCVISVIQSLWVSQPDAWPQSIKQGVGIYLHKKGDRHDLGNYRVIMLLPIISRCLPVLWPPASNSGPSLNTSCIIFSGDLAPIAAARIQLLCSHCYWKWPMPMRRQPRIRGIHWSWYCGTSLKPIRVRSATFVGNCFTDLESWSSY